MFNRSMKHEQRFRLNRLADTLVTVQRYGHPFHRAWDQPMLFLFDEVDAAHPAVVYVNAMLMSDADVKFCPYGNPDCPLPHYPVGYGKHTACYHDMIRREQRVVLPVGTLAGHRESRA